MAIQQGPYHGLREMALFAGAGGGILGGHLLGWRTDCAVEWDAYAASVLVARQNDEALRPFPVWDDVQTFDGYPWKGRIDVVSGGFPCQDISAAGRGAGITGPRSGMWKHFARIIREVEPKFVFVENSPLLTSRGLHVVLGALAEMGYDAEWGVLGADDCGADHRRKRIWIVAHSPKLHSHGGSNHSGFGVETQSEPKSRNRGGAQTLADPDGPQREGGGVSCGVHSQNPIAGIGSWWLSEPNVGRVVDGVAFRMDKCPDRLRAIGNGQVPLVAATAFRILADRLLSK